MKDVFFESCPLHYGTNWIGDMRTDTGKIIRLEDYKQTDYSIGTVHLAFKLAHLLLWMAMDLFSNRSKSTAKSLQPTPFMSVPTNSPS